MSDNDYYVYCTSHPLQKPHSIPPISKKVSSVPTRFHVEQNRDSLGINLTLSRLASYYPDKVNHLDAQEEIFS